MNRPADPVVQAGSLLYRRLAVGWPWPVHCPTNNPSTQFIERAMERADKPGSIQAINKVKQT